MSDKAKLIESIQTYLGRGKWKEAVSDMEKLFALDLLQHPR